MKQTEKDIQNSIIRLLKKHNIYYWRNNTGMMKIGNRIIRYGKVGSSDIFGFHNGCFFAIEVKSETGRLTEHQENFLNAMHEHTYCIGFVARSKEDVKIRLNLK